MDKQPKAMQPIETEFGHCCTEDQEIKVPGSAAESDLSTQAHERTQALANHPVPSQVDQKARSERTELRLKVATAFLGLLTALATGLGVTAGLFVKKTSNANRQVDVSHQQVQELERENASLKARVAALESSETSPATPGDTKWPAAGNAIFQNATIEIPYGNCGSQVSIDLDGDTSQADSQRKGPIVKVSSTDFPGADLLLDDCAKDSQTFALIGGDLSTDASERSGPDECARLISSSPSPKDFPVKAGTHICVATPAGDIARIDIARVGGTKPPTISAKVTLWKAS